MLLPISSIKPAPDPIRKTWDEEKLNELAQSIAEQGLIVPIKVRPHPELEKWVCHKHGYETLAAESGFDSQELAECLLCGELQDKFWGEHEHAWFEYDKGEIEPAFPFEVVYGHRRLEAVRRNGATEIECIVEAMNDVEALIEALVENLQREDLHPIEEAQAYQALMDLAGWNQTEIGRKVGKSAVEVGRCVLLLKESPEVLSMVEPSYGGGKHETLGYTPVTERHIRELRNTGIQFDDQTKVDVLKKAQREGLTSEQSRRIAESVAAAPSLEAKKVLLNTEYSPVIHDPENIKSRAKTYGAHDPLYRTDNGKAQQKAWDNAPEVKMIIDGVINAAKSWTMLIAEIRRMVEVGKMAPEGRQFTATKLRTLAQTLTAFADELEQEKVPGGIPEHA